jgi:tetratricopeptide (TPR) repeat protein
LTGRLALYTEGFGFFERGGPFVLVGPDSARRLLDLAAERFLAAIRIDSSWARPWSHLAQTRHWQATTSDGLANWKPRSDSLYRLSEAAALRAIDLDSTEATAWAALGYVRFGWKRDWFNSRDAYQTALRHNANSTEAEWGLALLYETTGELEEAIAAFRRVRAHDPRSYVLRYNLGNALICANRLEEGLGHLGPDSGPSLGTWERFSRANGLLRAKRYDQAIREFNRLLRPGETPPGNLAYAYFKTGDTTRARQIIRERKRALGPTGELLARSGETIAENLVIGDTTALLASLAALIQSKTLSPTIRCDPYFEDLIAIEPARAMMESGMKLQFTK